MDVLKKLSGIYENGYGPIYWFVMGDYTISLAAKTVYAYFCSYLSSDGDDSCFPKIETITHDLKMSKDLLYRSYEELINNDLIIIKNRSFFKNGKHTYTSNEYRLNMSPDRYDPAKVNKAIVEGTIKDLGFGLIPRKVMLDSSIDHEAKGVFAYYAARAGAIQEYRIDESETRRILHLSEYQLRKYRKQLAGRYIEMKYKKADEQYPAGFILTILSGNENKEKKQKNVDNSDVSTKTVKKKETQNVDNSRELTKTIKKKETQKKETENKEVEKKETNKNSFLTVKNSYIRNNSVICHHNNDDQVTHSDELDVIGLTDLMAYIKMMQRIGSFSEAQAAKLTVRAYLFGQAIIEMANDNGKYYELVYEKQFLKTLFNRSLELQQKIIDPTRYAAVALEKELQEVET